jgi:hypothetical protein
LLFFFFFSYRSTLWKYIKNNLPSPISKLLTQVLSASSPALARELIDVHFSEIEKHNQVDISENADKKGPESLFSQMVYKYSTSSREAFLEKHPLKEREFIKIWMNTGSFQKFLEGRMNMLMKQELLKRRQKEDDKKDMIKKFKGRFADLMTDLLIYPPFFSPPPPSSPSPTSSPILQSQPASDVFSNVSGGIQQLGTRAVSPKASPTVTSMASSMHALDEYIFTLFEEEIDIFVEKKDARPNKLMVFLSDTNLPFKTDSPQVFSQSNKTGSPVGTHRRNASLKINTLNLSSKHHSTQSFSGTQNLSSSSAMPLSATMPLNAETHSLSSQLLSPRVNIKTTPVTLSLSASPPQPKRKTSHESVKSLSPDQSPNSITSPIISPVFSSHLPSSPSQYVPWNVLESPTIIHESFPSSNISDVTSSATGSLPSNKPSSPTTPILLNADLSTNATSTPPNIHASSNSSFSNVPFGSFRNNSLIFPHLNDPGNNLEKK